MKVFILTGKLSIFILGFSYLDDDQVLATYLGYGEQHPYVNSLKTIRVVLGGQGKTLAYLEFDGSGSSFINWFSKSRLLHSSWYDLKPNSQTNFFSIVGHHAHVKRHFYINRNYGGCPNDAGWFVVIEKKDVCSWPNKGVLPLFMYSKGSRLTNWNRSPGFADVMNVYIQTV